MMSETEIRTEVAERAERCPGCGWVPENVQVSKESDGYEEHYSIHCRDCSKWIYDDDRCEWAMKTPPGEPNPRVSRA